MKRGFRVPERAHGAVLRGVSGGFATSAYSVEYHSVRGSLPRTLNPLFKMAKPLSSRKSFPIFTLPMHQPVISLRSTQFSYAQRQRIWL